MTLTNQQKHVMAHLEKGYRIMWIPGARIARYLNRQGHVYAKTFEALRDKGVIALHEKIEGRDGMPYRELWRAL